jgi:membrane-associated protein
MTTSVLVDLALDNILDARSLLTAFGVAGIFVVLFTETGLSVGFFLPGLAAVHSGPAQLARRGATAAVAVGAGGRRRGRAARGAGRVSDRAASGACAHRPGPPPQDRRGHDPVPAPAGPLRSRPGDRAGRFIPVIRTVLNPVAGALGLPARTFTGWQFVGGLVWTVGLVFAGFLLGRSIPGVDQYLLPIIALIVGVSLIPLAIEELRARRRRGPSV